MPMFNFIKNQLNKIYQQFSTKIQSIFSRNRVDEQTLQELENLLITADTGPKLTKKIINNIREQIKAGTIKEGADLKNALEQNLLASLPTLPDAARNCSVFLMVGINGSGKTTSAAKLAHQYIKQGKKVLLVACDTFRAAAVAQLQEWANRIGASIYTGQPNQDPAAVAFAGCQQFKDQHFDIVIIDTAGRLQTKTNLMKELEKIERVIKKQLPETPICTLLTIDAMLGQNSLEQATLFHESTKLSGIILTKMDGTGKGGIIIAIADAIGIPVAYICYGEGIEQIRLFDPQEYVQQLLNG